MKCIINTLYSKLCVRSATSCASLYKVCWPVISHSVYNISSSSSFTTTTTTTRTTISAEEEGAKLNDSSFQQNKGTRRVTEVTPKVLQEESETKTKSSNSNTDVNNTNQEIKENHETLVCKKAKYNRPVNNVVMTACGRFLNWEIYREALDAMLDKRWAKKIMMETYKDEECLQSVRQHGTVLSVISEIQRDKHDDEELRDEIMARVQTDYKLAIILCAVQDAYARIRQERRDDEIARIAEGKSSNAAKSLRDSANLPFGFG